MTGQGIQLEIYSYTAITAATPKWIIPFRKNPTGLEQLKGYGGGGFWISRTDPKYVADKSMLDSRNMCKVRVDGVVVSAFLLGKRTSTIIGTGEEADVGFEINGEGLKSWFDDAEVYAATGIKPESPENRYFNFATEQGTWYVPGNWNNPTVYGPVQVFGTHGWKDRPFEWPTISMGAQWIGAGAYSGSMPYEPSYYRWEINITTAGLYALYIGADDSFVVYVDGAEHTKSNELNTAYHEATRIEITLSTGNHVIAFKIKNRQAVNFNGPVGMVASLVQVGLDGVETLFGNSGSGTWKVLPYTNTVPGWSVGEVVLKLLSEATARGVLFPSYLTPTFTAALDSNGVAWADKQEWVFGTGESYASVLSKIEEFYDVWINPATRQLNILPVRGTNYDLTHANPIKFAVGKDLLSAKTEARGKIKNAMLIKTLDGWVEQTDTASIAKYGRIEASMKTETNKVFAGQLATLIFSQRAIEEEGASYELIVTNKIPFVHFFPGDWVLAPNDRNEIVKRRVMSIAVTENEAGAVVYTIEFDTIFTDNEQRLAKIVSKLGGGGVGGGSANAEGITSGGVGGVILPPSNDQTIKYPKAPTSVTAVSTGYWSANGVTALSSVVVSWAAVTQYTDNSTLTPAKYEVWGRQTLPTATGWTKLTETGGTTVTIPNFTPASTWEFAVVAVSPGGIPSAFSTAATEYIEPPILGLLAPDVPTLTSSRGTLTIGWSGLLSGAAPPSEFRYVYAEIASSSSGPWQRMGPVFQRDTRTIPIPSLTIGNNYYARLQAVDGSNLISDASPIAGPHTLQGIIGPDIIAASVDANILIAGSVKTSHLSPEVGNEIVIEGNVSIQAVEAAAADAVDAAQAAQADVALARTYYDFGPTGAVISSPGSPFATAVRNDKIEMLENGNTVSYWNSGTLYVNQLVGFKVTLGNHQIEQYAPDGTIIRAL